MTRRHDEIWWLILEQLTRIADSLANGVRLELEIKDDEDKDSPELA